MAYLTATLAEAYAELADGNGKNTLTSRAAGLLMVRNLDEFFYGPPSRRHPHDLRFLHYHDVFDWRPTASRKVASTNRDRLDRTIAHVVDHDPGHFGTRKAVKSLFRPTFENACDFLRRRHDLPFGSTSKAKEYIISLNGRLLSISAGYKTWKLRSV